MAFAPEGGPSSEPTSGVPRAPLRPVYVLRADTGEEPHLLTDRREVEWNEAVRVASSLEGRFVSVGDAIDNAPDLREGLLALSPDPALARWRRFRAIALAAPVSWSMFVLADAKQVSDLASDARKVVESAAFKAAELDPETAVATRARHAKIDRAVAMRWTYAGIEAAIGLAAIIIVIAGLRRFRAVPMALGIGAGCWWLFHAGQPQFCFGPKAFRELALAVFGIGGALATFLLAPSEGQVATALRARLGVPRAETAPRFTVKDADLVALLAAVWAGIALPFLLRALGARGVHDLARATFFVFFCLATFLGFLAYRRDETRVAPRWKALALAAALGFGVTTACDLAARSTLATAIEARTCISPESAAKLKTFQESSAKETTAARKETQTQVLAFWIAVLAAPLAEEMLYRGTIQRLARRRLGPRWAALLSGCVFGVAHALAFPAAFYQHFGLGLAFAAVFELAGGGAAAVAASAATHAMWNAWLAGMPVF